MDLSVVRLNLTNVTFCDSIEHVGFIIRIIFPGVLSKSTRHLFEILQDFFIIHDQCVGIPTYNIVTEIEPF